jgi:hypothetical protein
MSPTRINEITIFKKQNQHFLTFDPSVVIFLVVIITNATYYFCNKRHSLLVSQISKVKTKVVGYIHSRRVSICAWVCSEFGGMNNAIGKSITRPCCPAQCVRNIQSNIGASAFFTCVRMREKRERDISVTDPLILMQFLQVRTADENIPDHLDFLTLCGADLGLQFIQLTITESFWANKWIQQTTFPQNQLPLC